MRPLSSSPHTFYKQSSLISSISYYVTPRLERLTNLNRGALQSIHRLVFALTDGAIRLSERHQKLISLYPQEHIVFLNAESLSHVS